MKAPACSDKVIKSTTGGPMGTTQTHKSAQYSGAKAGDVSYERNSALNKTNAQNPVPGGDKPMPVIKSVLGQA